MKANTSPQQSPPPQIQLPEASGVGQGQNTQGQANHSERFDQYVDSVNVKESSIFVLSRAMNYIPVSVFESCSALDLKIVTKSNTGDKSNPSGTSSSKAIGAAAGNDQIANNDGSSGDGKDNDTKKDGQTNAVVAQETKLLVSEVFNTVNEKVKKLYGSPLLKKLTIEDLAIIFSYTYEASGENITSFYKAINSALAKRAADRTLEGGGYILNLISAIRKLPEFPRETKLYRGVCGRINKMNLKIKSILSWPAFTSTTYDPSTAMYFIERGKIDSSKGEGRYLFIIAKSFHGREISQFSRFGNECEVLFEP